jgi:hypothetical protein
VVDDQRAGTDKDTDDERGSPVHTESSTAKARASHQSNLKALRNKGTATAARVKGSTAATFGPDSMQSTS